MALWWAFFQGVVQSGPKWSKGSKNSQERLYILYSFEQTFSAKVCSDHCELLRQFISDQTKLDAVQWKCIWRGSTMPLWTESQYLIADHPRTTWSEENWNITNMSSGRRKYSENIMFTYSSILPPVMPSYSQISHFGGIQAHFHFMSSQLFYAQTFPHSTITNILEKTVLKPHLIFEKLN